MRKGFENLVSSLTRGGGDPKWVSLQQLSDLATDEVDFVRQRWPDLPLDARRRLIERMVETAELDVTYDFTMVFRIALGDEDPRVRAMAVDGLWEDEDPRLAEVLASMLGKDPSVEVRSAVASGLEHFAMLAELDELPKVAARRVREALLATVRNSSEDAKVRYRAIESLSSLSGDEIDAEIDRVYHVGEPSALVAALYAMGHSGDPRWAPYVTSQLGSSDPAIRLEAVRAAGELEAPETVEPLLRMITDPDSEVKQAVLEALGNIGGPQAKMVLEELSKSDDEATSQAASEALSELLFRADPLAPIPLSLTDEGLESLEEEDEEPEEGDGRPTAESDSRQ